MDILWLIIVGLVVGALGRLVNPGRDPMGWLVTIAVGIGAVLITGALIGPYDDMSGWDYVVAVIVAAVLVTVVGRFWPNRERRVAV